MHSPGVEVRPLRQMSGGSSFNEVFLDGVWVADADRLGAVGGGWQVAITTLGFERVVGSRLTGGAPNFCDLLMLTARHLGRASDLIVRQGLAAVWADQKIRWLITRRADAARQAGGVPGAEGSIGKLAMTEGLRRIADVASLILGPRLVADSGEWGTFSWSEFVCGVPGSRVAGGTDEVQRNIIAERVLGLPREPR
jgi:acyl-CoA dehydrogenase